MHSKWVITCMYKTDICAGILWTQTVLESIMGQRLLKIHFCLTRYIVIILFFPKCHPHITWLIMEMSDFINDVRLFSENWMKHVCQLFRPMLSSPHIFTCNSRARVYFLDFFFFFFHTVFPEFVSCHLGENILLSMHALELPLTQIGFYGPCKACDIDLLNIECKLNLW